MCVEGLGKSLANLDYNSVRHLDIPSLRFLAFFLNQVFYLVELVRVFIDLFGRAGS